MIPIRSAITAVTKSGIPLLAGQIQKGCICEHLTANAIVNPAILSALTGSRLGILRSSNNLQSFFRCWRALRKKWRPRFLYQERDWFFGGYGHSGIWKAAEKLIDKIENQFFVFNKQKRIDFCSYGWTKHFCKNSNVDGKWPNPAGILQNCTCVGGHRCIYLQILWRPGILLLIRQFFGSGYSNYDLRHTKFFSIQETYLAKFKNRIITIQAHRKPLDEKS